MKMEKPYKCSRRKNVITPCSTLSKVVNGHNGRGPQGVTEWTYIKISGPQDGKLSRVFYGAKSGSFKERGIAFNFCPFCGKDIDVWSKDDASPAKKQRAPIAA